MIENYIKLNKPFSIQMASKPDGTPGKFGEFDSADQLEAFYDRNKTVVKKPAKKKVAPIQEGPVNPHVVLNKKRNLTRKKVGNSRLLEKLNGGVVEFPNEPEVGEEV